MNDSTQPDLDMRDFCARILREYEDVISQIIQRPIPVRRGADEPSADVPALAALSPNPPSQPISRS